MNIHQKGFANIISVVLIVVFIGALGYFALVKKSEQISQQTVPTPTQITNEPSTNPTLTAQPSITQQTLPTPTKITTTPTTNPTLTPQPSNQQIPSVHTTYKEIFSESFDYGNGEQQFGIVRVAGGSGPTSFYTNSRNDLYITDPINKRIKIFNPDGKLKSIINTEPLIDIVIDNDGNIYGYTMGPGVPGIIFYKYDSNGSLLGKIENPPAFAEIFSSQNAYGELYIFGKNLFISDAQQNSYLISSTERESFKAETATKIDGIYGLSGRRYKTNYTGGGTVQIIDQDGVTERNIVLGITGLEGIKFLGEDQYGNFYIQTEIKNGNGIKLQVYKYNASGNLLTILDIPPIDYYSIWMVKLLHVDPTTGDIWQVIPGQSKLFINRWSTIY